MTDNTSANDVKTLAEFTAKVFSNDLPSFGLDYFNNHDDPLDVGGLFRFVPVNTAELFAQDKPWPGLDPVNVVVVVKDIGRYDWVTLFALDSNYYCNLYHNGELINTWRIGQL